MVLLLSLIASLIFAMKFWILPSIYFSVLLMCLLFVVQCWLYLLMIFDIIMGLWSDLKSRITFMSFTIFMLFETSVSKILGLPCWPWWVGTWEISRWILLLSLYVHNRVAFFLKVLFCSIPKVCVRHLSLPLKVFGLLRWTSAASVLLWVFYLVENILLLQHFGREWRRFLFLLGQLWFQEYFQLFLTPIAVLPPGWFIRWFLYHICDNFLL